jgi:hypothetical protein
LGEIAWVQKQGSGQLSLQDSSPKVTWMKMQKRELERYKVTSVPLNDKLPEGGYSSGAKFKK